MRRCGNCKDTVPPGANLCILCADALQTPEGFCAEQLLSTALRPTEAVLIDCWGRLHFIEEMTPLGRRPAARGIAILDSSVSRNHAEISRDSDGSFNVRDVGSSNGTSVDGTEITAITPLAQTCRLSFGGIELYFTSDSSELIRDGIVASTVTIQAEPSSDLELDELPQPEDVTFAGFPKIPIHLIARSAGGAGLVDIGDSRIPLTQAQYDLMQLLVEQMRSEAGQVIEVRGFLPSSQLIAQISWDTAFPTDNHLKQLIRRVRKILESEGLGNLIESRRGFGYRLRCIPR